MSRYQLFKYATLGLLVLNLFLLGLAFLPTKSPPRRMPPDDLNFRSEVINMLDLNAEQEARFREEATQHAQVMKRLSDRQRELLEPYFHSMVDSIPLQERDSLLGEIEKLEGEKIRYTRKHFEAVRAMLSPAQQVNFEEFIHAALSIVLQKQRSRPPPHKKNPPPPKDFR